MSSSVGTKTCSAALDTSTDEALTLVSNRLALAEKDTQGLQEAIQTFGVSRYEPMTPSLPATSVSNSRESVVTRLCRAESTIHRLKQQLQQLQSDRDLKLQQREDAVSKLHQVGGVYEKESKKLHQEINRYKLEEVEMQEKLSKRDADIATLQLSLDAAMQQKTEYGFKIQQLEGCLERNKRSMTDLSSELTSERQLREGLEAAQQSMLHACKQTDTALESERKQVNELDRSAQQLRSDVLQLRSGLEREKSARKQTEAVNQSLRAQTETFSKQLIALREDKTLLVSELEKMTHNYTQLNSQLKAMDELVQDLQESSSSLEIEKTAAEDRISSLEAELQTIRSLHIKEIENERNSWIQKIESNDKLISTRESLRAANKDLDAAQDTIVELKQKVTESVCDLDAAHLEHENTIRQKEREITTLTHQLKVKEGELERFAQDKALLLKETNESVERLTEEQVTSQSQLSTLRTEADEAKRAHKQLADDRVNLLQRIAHLEQLLGSQKDVEGSLNRISDEKQKLSYEKGQLQTKVSQLESQVEEGAASSIVIQRQKKEINTLQAKLEKTHSEAQSLQMSLQQRDVQIKQAQASLQRKEHDFNMALQARDAALREKDSISSQKNETAESTKVKVQNLHQRLEEAESDNKQLADTLDEVMAAKRQAQTALEHLQLQAGAKDEQITEISSERNELRKNMGKLEKELEVLQEKLGQVEDMETNELQPLRNALHEARAEARSSEQGRRQLQSELETLETQLQSLQNKTTKLVQDRSQRSDVHSAEVRAAQQRVEHLQSELQRERTASSKRSSKDAQHMRLQTEGLITKNGELSRANSDLRHKVNEQQIKIKELSLKNESLRGQIDHLRDSKTKFEETDTKFKRLRLELKELEKSKESYLKVNQDQTETIERFMSEIEGLRSALGDLTLELKQKSKQLVERDEKIDQINKKLLKLKGREKDQKNLQAETEMRLKQAHHEMDKMSEKLDNAQGWFKDKLRALEEELEIARSALGGLEEENKRSRKLLKKEKIRSAETNKKANEMVEASRAALNRLSDFAETAQKETERTVRQLSGRLQAERRQAANAQSKYDQLKISSARHVETLARELHSLSESQISD